MPSRRSALLGVLTTSLALAEAVALQWVHYVSALPLAPQVSAPAPFGTFHDVRWIWTYGWSWWSVAWMLAALLAFRSLVNAAVIHLAWPSEATRPSYGTLLRRSLPYTLLALAVISPWAAVSFAASAAGFSQLMLGAIIGTVIVALVLPPAIITGHWWRRVLPWRSMGWVALSWLELMVAALAMTYAPAWVTLLVAAGGGLFNAWAWHQIVHTVVHAGAPRWTVPALPVLSVVVSGGLVAAGAASFATTFGGPAGGSREAIPTPQVRPSGHPVLYVPGFGSSYDGGRFQLFGPGWQTVHFSYRGLSSAGTPLPYPPQATYQSLATSAQRLARQIDALHRKSGTAVSVVAESEGTMVARAYFAAHPHPPVDVFVQTSPLVRPARVYYPRSGRDGYGEAGAAEFRGLLGLARLETHGFGLHADVPFLRSLVANAALYRDQALCPVPGVTNHMFVPLEAALTVYRGPYTDTPWTALPAFHAGLVGDLGVQKEIAQVLRTGNAAGHQGWRAAFEVIRGAAGAWQVPGLPLQQRTQWGAAPNSDPEFGHHACPAA